MQCFRPRLPPEAINFLTVHTNDVAQIAVPPENRAEHVVKFVERHLSRLLGSPDPRLFGALVAMVWFPPFADRRNLWTLDGDTVRYTGLLLFLIGGTIRTASIFALEHRFSGFVAVQANHKLKTDGIYRFIRHPSYMGALLAMIGLVLIFRSGVALLLIPLMLLVILHRIKDEEEFLQSEFGAEYTDYRRRTWRLFPFIY